MRDDVGVVLAIGDVRALENFGSGLHRAVGASHPAPKTVGSQRGHILARRLVVQGFLAPAAQDRRVVEGHAAAAGIKGGDPIFFRGAALGTIKGTLGNDRHAHVGLNRGVDAVGGPHHGAVQNGGRLAFKAHVTGDLEAREHHGAVRVAGHVEYRVQGGPAGRRFPILCIAAKDAHGGFHAHHGDGVGGDKDGNQAKGKGFGQRLEWRPGGAQVAVFSGSRVHVDRRFHIIHGRGL